MTDRRAETREGCVWAIVALLPEPREQSREPEIPIRPCLRASIRIVGNENASLGPVVQRPRGHPRQLASALCGVVPSRMTEREENELLLILGECASGHGHAAPLTA